MVWIDAGRVRGVATLKRIERDKCHYSNQDFDVLSAAFRAIGKCEVADYNRVWVEANQQPVYFTKTA